MARFSTFERLGHLEYIPLPGGDAAAREPYRMAISYLYASYGTSFKKLMVCQRWDREKIDLLTRMMQKGVNSPLTSSAGRLFDAASSLLGLRDISTYEGQAAMELEAVARRDTLETYPFEVETSKGASFLISPRKTVLSLVQDLVRGVPRPIVAGKFHNTVAHFILEGCLLSRSKTGIRDVVLSGGVFQNKLLTEKTLMLLERDGFMCHHHGTIPPNDGGISLGQAAVAAFKLDEGLI